MNYGCDSSDICLTYKNPGSISLKDISSPAQTAAMLFCVIFCFVLFMLTCTLFRVYVKYKSRVFRDANGKKKTTVAFFHPYCNAGGGGERVLWVAVRSIQKKYPDVQCVVYSGDVDATSEQILLKARQRFNIVLPGYVEFVFLNSRSWVEAKRYPYLTLLGQSLGSLVLGFEALLAFAPDVCIDTMGYAFTMPLFKYLGGCRVACYVHYPTISTDMLHQVSQRVVAHNNASFISRSPVLSRVKLLYYHLFAMLYGVAGRCADVVIVNSTWTYNHIMQLWKAGSRTHILYPPCDVKDFLAEPLTDDKNKPHQILSLGQFRPEKDHPLQIKAFHKFLSLVQPMQRLDYKLVLAGSCRHEEDQARVDRLRELTKELGIQDHVEFRLNIPFPELKQLLFESVISLHTMWNEHFGICVVEGMAAGTVMLAHDSGGPKMDIVVEHNNKRTGFLASDVDSYAATMQAIFAMTALERLELRKNARLSVSKFSEEEFENVFMTLCDPILKIIKSSM